MCVVIQIFKRSLSITHLTILVVWVLESNNMFILMEAKGAAYVGFFLFVTQGEIHYKKGDGFE